MIVTIAFHGKKYVFEIEETQSVNELKQKLDEIIDLSIDRMELKYNNNIITNPLLPLSSYGIEDGSIIEMSVLRPQLHSKLLIPSASVYSFIAMLLIFISTSPRIPSIEQSTKLTAFMTCVVIGIYCVVKFIIGLVFDRTTERSVGMLRVMGFNFTAVLVSAFISYEVCYRGEVTYSIASIFGSLNTFSCMAAIAFHHMWLNDCYDQYNRLKKLPTKGLYKFITCPTFLFEGLFYTALMITTSFAFSGIVICIVMWVVVFKLANKRHADYQKLFPHLQIKHKLIPFIY